MAKPMQDFLLGKTNAALMASTGASGMVTLATARPDGISDNSNVDNNYNNIHKRSRTSTKLQAREISGPSLQSTSVIHLRQDSPQRKGKALVTLLSQVPKGSNDRSKTQPVAPTGGNLEKQVPQSTAHSRQQPNTDTDILGGRQERSDTKDPGISTPEGNGGRIPPVGRFGRVART